MQKETKVGIEVANPLTLTQGDYPVSSRCAQCNHIVPLSGRRRPKHESERCSRTCSMRGTAIADFKGGQGLHPTVQGITFVRTAGSHVKPALPLRAERASENPKPDLHRLPPGTSAGSPEPTVPPWRYRALRGRAGPSWAGASKHPPLFAPTLDRKQFPGPEPCCRLSTDSTRPSHLPRLPARGFR